METKQSFYPEKDKQACWRILPKVSRSFALCIRVLPKPIDEQMAIAYLLYRIIDTVEDCDSPVESKRVLFAGILRAMGKAGYSHASAQKCRDDLLIGIKPTPAEAELLLNFDALLRAYYLQPPEVRRAILRWGRVMAKGMYEFLRRRISTLEDQNKYSFYVAGVVGYLINDILFYNKVIDAKLRSRLRSHAKAFGLALQKVNILRDVARDIKEGRRYWPSLLIEKYHLTYETLCLPENRESAKKILREQINDSLKYLHSAMYYIVSLPKGALRVRMFCAIPLFMAIESFARCARSGGVFDIEGRVKISRFKVYEIVTKSWVYGVFNGLLVGWFYDSLGRDIPIPEGSPLLARQEGA